MVTSMGPIDLVVGAQRQRGSYGAALLTDRGMRRTVNQSLGHEIENLFLEGADQMQTRQHRPQHFRIRLVPVRVIGRQFDPLRSRRQILDDRHSILEFGNKQFETSGDWGSGAQARLSRAARP